MFFYKTYGLNICSEFHIPELIESEKKPDIYIQKGKIHPPKLEPTSIQRQGLEALFGGNINETYLRWQGVATLLAKDGNTLIVDPDSDDIDPQLLNLYILSEALGLILYQRGLFLLHASAVKINEQVVIFAGCPGAGKSTTAAAFAKCGYIVLGDDMVAMSFNSTNQAMVYPAFPQIKIWAETVKGLGYNQSKLPPLFRGSRKSVIQNKANFPDKPFPLTHIFIIEKGAEFNSAKMLGTEAFFSLSRFFPLPSELLQGVACEQHFQKCIQLANQADISKLENPKDFRVLKQLITWVENKLGKEDKQQCESIESSI